MTTFYFEAPLVIAPKGTLRVTGMAKPTRPFDIYHKLPFVIRGALGLQGDIGHGVSVQCVLDYRQVWGPVTPTFNLEQAQVRIVGKLRA